MLDHSKVAIFWDYENCSPSSNAPGLGYDIVNNLGRMARVFGCVSTFKAYLDISAQSPKSVPLRSELQSSGVSMIDCPHNGKKEVVDKMILVDLLAFAVDNPPPATVILITGDRDYAYAMATLRLRKYKVVLIVPQSPHVHVCLESQASVLIDWTSNFMMTQIRRFAPPSLALARSNAK
ncbi:NYN domain-containing protein [Phlebopus sp. FC_14]|nr:NYN domain-containing protein [Phlebopus sp. FC_14]